MRPRVVIVNQAHPELDQLACEMKADGRLAELVHSYYNRGGRLERLLEGLSPLHEPLESRRRPVLAAIENPRIAGRFWEVADLLVRRKAALQRIVSRETLLDRRALAVDRKGARCLGEREGVDAVVCNFGAALNTFIAAQRMGILTVLNYPVAHHSHLQSLVPERRSRPLMDGALDPGMTSTFRRTHYSEEIHLADLVLLPSDFVKKTFLSAGVPESKLAVCPFGAPDVGPLRRSSGGGGRKPLKLLFCGQVGFRKGYHVLEAALDALRYEELEVDVVGPVVGEVPLSIQSKRVNYLASRPRSEVLGLMAASDVLVAPSLAEGLPMVVLEAVAVGLPVIATRTGADEVVRDETEGLLVDAGDATSLATAILKLRTHPELLGKFAEAALLRSREFSWDRYYDGVVKAICERLTSAHVR